MNGISKRKLTLLELHGADAPDFLHRMSTNDILSIKSGEHGTTLLTNEKGRIVDLVTVIKKDSSLVLVCSDGNSQKVKAWLEKFIIMEDVQINDITSDYSIYSYFGGDVNSILLNFEQAQSLNPGKAVFRFGKDNKSFCCRDDQWKTDTYYMALSNGDEHTLLKDLTEIKTIGEAEFEVFRIEQGIPLNDKDFSEQVNPLEAGLDKFISFTKGCYIGQEIIARLDTYKKVQKHFTGFYFSDPALSSVREGIISKSGAAVGRITSQVYSRRINKLIALGYLKTGVESDQFDYIINGSTDKIEIHLCPLPFN